ncbi:unnamed protein product [Owenia fusiformis]|uniref:Uncharacterized protein n=1 Tax=Owenia fusiformis TaxID=6347 RepID=A0A8S4QA58_OWEFU|nr:unnamed protein product [Owenia fusiformis]
MADSKSPTRTSRRDIDRVDYKQLHSTGQVPLKLKTEVSEGSIEQSQISDQVNEVPIAIHNIDSDLNSSTSSVDSSDDDKAIELELIKLRKVEKNCKRNKIKAMRREISDIRNSIENLETETDSINRKNNWRRNGQPRQSIPEKSSKTTRINDQKQSNDDIKTGSLKTKEKKATDTVCFLPSNNITDRATGAISKNSKSSHIDNLNATDLRRKRTLKKVVKSKVPTIFESSSESESSTTSTDPEKSSDQSDSDSDHHHKHSSKKNKNRVSEIERLDKEIRDTQRAAFAKGV